MERYLIRQLFCGKMNIIIKQNDVLLNSGVSPPKPSVNDNSGISPPKQV